MKVCSDNKENIQNLREAAQMQYPDHPVIRDLTIVQGILEAGFTRPAPSRLALNYNNLFGMKAKENEENNVLSVYLVTEEQASSNLIKTMAWFRKFNNMEDCLIHRTNLLNEPRYKNLWSCESFEEAAQMIKNDGYATDNSYTKLLNALYRQYIKGK